MFNKTILGMAVALVSCSVFAEDVPIQGIVESKCVIQTDTSGIYGNPQPNMLSTAQVDGGVVPVVRYDVISADFYKARISYPNEFSSAPELSDVVNWTGNVSVTEGTDPLMSEYDTVKIEYNNVTEYDLAFAGSTWFSIESTADYGFNKSFPAGNYTGIVVAECIAK